MYLHGGRDCSQSAIVRASPGDNGTTRVVRRPFARFFSRMTTRFDSRSKSCAWERRISLRLAPVWAAIRIIG